MPKYPPQVRKLAQAASPPGEVQAAGFGDRVRAMRKDAGLTLDGLSDASGISRAALSKIERGEMSPTYDTLLKLAQGFDCEVALLVSGRRPAGGNGFDVTRALPPPATAGEGFVHKLLAPDLAHRALFAFVTDVHATQPEKARHTHDSEDFLYVLEGTIAVHLGEQMPIVLQAGDSLQMDGRIPHTMTALPSPDKPRARKPVARMLWVSVPTR